MFLYIIMAKKSIKKTKKKSIRKKSYKKMKGGNKTQKELFEKAIENNDYNTLLKLLENDKNLFDLIDPNMDLKYIFKEDNLVIKAIQFKYEKKHNNKNIPTNILKKNYNPILKNMKNNKEK